MKGTVHPLNEEAVTDISAFSETYLDARAKFLAAASELNAAVTSYQHPGQSGPGGRNCILTSFGSAPAMQSWFWSLDRARMESKAFPAPRRKPTG